MLRPNRGKRRQNITYSPRHIEFWTFFKFLKQVLCSNMNQFGSPKQFFVLSDLSTIFFWNSFENNVYYYYLCLFGFFRVRHFAKDTRVFDCSFVTPSLTHGVPNPKSIHENNSYSLLRRHIFDLLFSQWDLALPYKIWKYRMTNFQIILSANYFQHNWCMNDTYVDEVENWIIHKKNYKIFYCNL